MGDGLELLVRDQVASQREERDLGLVGAQGQPGYRRLSRWDNMDRAVVGDTVLHSADQTDGSAERGSGGSARCSASSQTCCYLPDCLLRTSTLPSASS